MTAVAGQDSGYKIMLRHFTPDTPIQYNMKQYSVKQYNMTLLELQGVTGRHRVREGALVRDRASQSAAWRRVDTIPAILATTGNADMHRKIVST